MDDDSPELTCNITDGWFKPGHKECEKCVRNCRSVCSVFAMEFGLVTPEEVLADNDRRIEEYKARKREEK